MSTIGIIKANRKYSGPVRHNPEWEERAKNSRAILANHKYAMKKKEVTENERVHQAESDGRDSEGVGSDGN